MVGFGHCAVPHIRVACVRGTFVELVHARQNSGWDLPVEFDRFEDSEADNIDAAFSETGDCGVCAGILNRILQHIVRAQIIQGNNPPCA